MPVLKKIRFLVRLTVAFISEKFKIIFLGVLLGIIFFSLSPTLAKWLPKPSKTEKIGILGKYTLSEIPQEILAKISFGVTRVLPDGSVVPEICDRWEASSDGTIYTFYFNNSKKFFWHDGSIFKPEDINYNFKDGKVLPIDSQMLKIILNEPFSPFPSVVSQPVFKKGLIGLGQYKVKRIEKSGQILKSILLVPFQKKVNSPQILYRFYTNEDYLKTAFKLGEINKIEAIEQTEDFSEWKNVSITPYQVNDRQVVLFFNTNKDPFSEKGFRQTIAYSIEKTENKSRAIGPISNLSWVFNPGIKKYEKDLTKAKLLLSKIKQSEKPSYTLFTFPSLEKEAENIRTDLESIRINIEIKITNFVPDDFDMFLAIQKIPNDPDQYSLWHTGQQMNLTHFSNPRIDKLLEDGRKTENKDERKKIYLDFQRFLVEESPAVFLYYPSYYSIERK